VCEVFVWQSLKKFSDTNYPDKQFRNDAARKQYLMKKGVKIQPDDQGHDGVAVAKEGEEEKEIRMGKRLAASKLRQFDYGSEPNKEDLKKQMEKNSAGLTVSGNTKDPRPEGACHG
jgi:hypothetical protein